jgi:hypothetical protein
MRSGRCGASGKSPETQQLGMHLSERRFEGGLEQRGCEKRPETIALEKESPIKASRYSRMQTHRKLDNDTLKV